MKKPSISKSYSKKSILSAGTLTTPVKNGFSLKRRIELITSFRLIQSVVRSESELFSDFSVKEKNQLIKVIGELGVGIFKKEISCHEDFSFIPMGSIEKLQNKLKNRLITQANKRLSTLKMKSIYSIVRAMILKSNCSYLLSQKQTKVILGNKMNSLPYTADLEIPVLDSL